MWGTRWRQRLRLGPLYLALRAADATLVVTNHSVFDADFIVRHSRLVVDTRNLTRAVRAGRERIVRA